MHTAQYTHFLLMKKKKTYSVLFLKEKKKEEEGLFWLYSHSFPNYQSHNVFMLLLILTWCCSMCYVQKVIKYYLFCWPEFYIISWSFANSPDYAIFFFFCNFKKLFEEQTVV